MLAPDGTCVTIGVTASPETTFSPVSMLQTGGTSLYALALFHEFRHRPAAPDLARLAQALADGNVNPHIEVERPWEEIEDVAQQLMSRSFTGKAVLLVQ
jgi:NADPH:quinone reductase-like Zn-dependent oxidoreductase